MTNFRTAQYLELLDPAHAAIDPFELPISKYIYQEKYQQPEELHYLDTVIRMVDGVYEQDENRTAKQNALYYILAGLWVPAGRIQAGAGTLNVVTLLNCYVIQTIGDSMDLIANALKDSMLTMQQGGGIGTDFSTLRPSGAYLKRTGAVASGPLPFMEMWDSMCATIKSAGSRRGAMMGTMHCDHPDLIAFIQAKHVKGVLENFNLSVLISDAFIDAVINNQKWYLGFNVPKADGSHLFTVEREEGDWYAYSEWDAKELWDLIIESTYEYSEPGIILIDRINDTNNLKHHETISCTNPCGEQPLPPNGACDLGAVNLARLVRDPFTDRSRIDYDLLGKVVTEGVRFLDNVLDVTNYPLEAQKIEAYNKRRVGIGILGLADALVQLRIRYGSAEALQATNKIMEVIKVFAYNASINLAKERGAFPLQDCRVPFGEGNPAFQSLTDDMQKEIVSNGIRNGCLLTIAPTGTTAMLCGNVSSGVEPVFAYEAKRKILQDDGTHKICEVTDYALTLWRSLYSDRKVPDYFVDVNDLDPADHIRMQAICQKHVDASISKTVNCPEDISFEDFKLVYWDALESGCKGCTTYRPS